MTGTVTRLRSIAIRIDEVAHALDASMSSSPAVEVLTTIADDLVIVANGMGAATPSGEVTRHTQQSSVSIDRTSTGKHSISIKVYDDDPEAARVRAIALLQDTEADLGLPSVDGGQS